MIQELGLDKVIPDTDDIEEYVTNLHPYMFDFNSLNA